MFLKQTYVQDNMTALAHYPIMMDFQVAANPSRPSVNAYLKPSKSLQRGADHTGRPTQIMDGYSRDFWVFRNKHKERNMPKLLQFGIDREGL